MSAIEKREIEKQTKREQDIGPDKTGLSVEQHYSNLLMILKDSFAIRYWNQKLKN